MTEGKWTTCWKCKTSYWLPIGLYDSAQASDKISFFCPYGHSAHFKDGPTDADKARRRAERAEQDNARLRDECDAANRRTDAAERSVAAQKGQVTKLKNRAKAGVCPCCNRTFQNLKRHMATKHPDTKPLKVIKGGKA